MPSPSKRACLECGASLEGRYHTTKFCNDTCGRRFHFGAPHNHARAFVPADYNQSHYFDLRPGMTGVTVRRGEIRFHWD